jgi:hypothetical protein
MPEPPINRAATEYMTRRAALSLPAIALVAVVMCGCDQGPPMYKVTGKVTYKDGSVPKGGVCSVQFLPTANTTAQVRKGASGAISPDGTFEMHTRAPGDGVNAGDYGVTFAIWQSPTDPRSLIPPKYSNPATSGYKITVDKDISDLKFEIEPLPGAVGGSKGG